jgi:hypothetical protein
MSREHDRELAAWLAAEAAGRFDEADSLFAGVFSRHVPRLEPAPRLSDRVVAAMRSRVGLPWLAPMPSWLRAATLALVAGGGLAAAWFWSIPAFDLLRAAWSVVHGAGIVAMVSAVLLDVIVRTWSNAASVGRALSVVATSGTGAVLLVANLGVAVGASMALKRLLAREAPEYRG